MHSWLIFFESNTYMKKKYFLKYILILSVFLITFSCKKANSKDEMIKDFVENYNSQKTKIQNSTMVFQKSEQTGENEITLNFSSQLSSEDVQPTLIKFAISDLMIQLIKKDPKNRQLLNKGVNFKINLTDKNGENITTEIINKSNMTSAKQDFGVNEKHNRLNQILEVSNSNLPIVDSASGIKIVTVSLGSDNDIIYTAEVPEKMQKLIITEENKVFIKKNMAKDQAFKKMVIELKDYDISSVKYQYRDKNGKLLQEMKMTDKDFK